MTQEEKQPFYVLKLVTGETLFAEIIGIEEEILQLLNPLLVKEQEDTLLAQQWMPYTDKHIHKLPIAMCYYMECLNKKFTKFYGSVILQSKITEIKEETFDTMNDREDYYTMSQGVERIKEISEFMQEKYDLDNGPDLSKFEEALTKFKPSFH